MTITKTSAGEGMSDAIDPAAQPHRRRPGGANSRRAVFIALGLDLVAPLAVFYGLRSAGASQWWALVLSAIVPAVMVLVRFARHRQVDFTALFVLTLLALGLVLSALTGNPRTLLIRDAWLGMTGGVAGLWLIGSVIYGRPGLFVLFRSFVLTKVGPEGLATWEARWGQEAGFRRNIRLLTLVWGVALLLSALVQLIAAYAVPIDVAPTLMNAAWPVIAVPLWIFHLTFTKRHGLRA
ncbi:MAG TPA: VC0807 family protein [Kineosporiaceae bacterium]|nr:VC0807 family protein [Kineosporiaceae bacterium]